MKSWIIKILYFTPRILSLLFVAFLSLFALDVFEQYQGWDVIPPLLMHLIPSLVLLAFIGVAWIYDLAGAVAFGGFGIWYIWSVGLDRHWSWYAAIAVPALIVSILYLAHWIVIRTGRSHHQTAASL